MGVYFGTPCHVKDGLVYSGGQVIAKADSSLDEKIDDSTPLGQLRAFLKTFTFSLHQLLTYILFNYRMTLELLAMCSTI